MLLVNLRFSVRIIAIRAKGTCLTLVIKTAHHRLVLARVWCCQPCSIVLCHIWGVHYGFLSHLLDILSLWWCEQGIQDLLVKFGSILNLSCCYFKNVRLVVRFVLGSVIAACLCRYDLWRRTTDHSDIGWACAGAWTLSRYTTGCNLSLQRWEVDKRQWIVIRSVATSTRGCLLSIATRKLTSWVFVGLNIIIWDILDFWCTRTCVHLWHSLDGSYSLLRANLFEKFALGRVLKFDFHLVVYDDWLDYLFMIDISILVFHFNSIK